MVRSLRITHIYMRLRSVALPSHFLHFLLNWIHALQVNFDFLGVMLCTALSVHTTNHKMKVRESHCISGTLLPPRTMTAESRSFIIARRRPSVTVPLAVTPPSLGFERKGQLIPRARNGTFYFDFVNCDG